MTKPVVRDAHFFMKQALAQARKALACDEVPIGAVVVSPEGIIVGRGYNQVERYGCQIAHAEMRALAQACKKVGDWRLNGYWVYVTLEPCSMCMNCMKLSRVSGIVYGAESPLFGYHLDNDAGHRVYNKCPVQIQKGVCAEEAVSLLKQFFKNKRKKGE
jgi:tRNA(adenine34) deaminase